VKDPRGTILAVDDNPTNLAILEEMLGEDYEVETATSGAEALDAAGRFRPSLVLLDVMMPEMSGYEVCRRMREDPRLRGTKIIMVSAKALLSERLEGYEAGADDYVTKPFEADELLFKVEVFLKLRAVEEVDRLKGEVLNLLAHEVRTPLNCLILPAEMLRSDEPMDEAERRRLGEIMYTNAVALHAFVNKALTLSAIRAGEWQPALEPVALHRLVAEAVEKLARKAAASGVSIEERRDGDGAVLADSGALVGVFESILDNAVRFSPGGGKILVAVSWDPQAARVIVEDAGPGIRPEHLPRVFDEFVDLSEGHHSSGHGLSLALARAVIERHGGEIEVASVQGAGARFTVRLPPAR
jgi:signal transduction histidine kinase